MNDRNYAHEIIDQLVDACGPQHPENWGPHDYKINEIANEAQDALEAQQARIDELESFLHSRLMHPNYEYETTTGQRKAFDEDPPYEDPNSWERNTDYGDNGWARFEYHEEAYWRRRKALAACKEGE